MPRPLERRPERRPLERNEAFFAKKLPQSAVDDAAPEPPREPAATDADLRATMATAQLDGLERGSSQEELRQLLAACAAELREMQRDEDERAQAGADETPGSTQTRVDEESQWQSLLGPREIWEDAPPGW